MLSKPAHLAPRYAAQFEQTDVVRAYRTRPAYPAAVFELLCALSAESEAPVLELGAGSADLTVGLAARHARVEAVEPSAAMLEVARSRTAGLPITWHHCAAEEFVFAGPYALVVAAESLHWMDWERVLPRVAGSLTPSGQLAIVTERKLRVPWSSELSELVGRYSTNRDYRPYDIVALLAERGLFRAAGRRTLLSPYRASLSDYVESFHSRNGLSRERMGESAASAFDAELRALAHACGAGTEVHAELSVEVVWGAPEHGTSVTPS